MAPNTRSGQNTADPANGGETGGEFLPTGNSATPNVGSVAGFTAKQSSSMQAQLAAQINASNQTIIDQIMERMSPNQQPNQQSNLRPNQSSQSSPHDEQIPPTNHTTNNTAVRRWRGEGLGTFDPTLNVSLQLKGLAKSYYEMELGPSNEAMLCEARTIHAWVNALIQRFRPAAADVLHQLEKTYYTRNDAAVKKDPVAFLHNILRLTRHDNRPDLKRLTIAYIHFES
ncbi:hypothetical protein BDR22DRAFT_889380 [Usnea florida]